MSNANKPASELTKLEYALIHSTWQPSKEAFDMEVTRDRNKNPHNDSYKPKLRSAAEIVNDLRKAHFTQILNTI